MQDKTSLLFFNSRILNQNDQENYFDLKENKEFVAKKIFRSFTENNVLCTGKYRTFGFVRRDEFIF